MWSHFIEKKNTFLWGNVFVWCSSAEDSIVNWIVTYQMHFYISFCACYDSKGRAVYGHPTLVSLLWERLNHDWRGTDVLPATVIIWFIKGHAVCEHVYVDLYLKEPQVLIIVTNYQTYQASATSWFMKGHAMYDHACAIFYVKDPKLLVLHVGLGFLTIYSFLSTCSL